MRDLVRNHRFASFYAIAVAIVAAVMVVRALIGYGEVLPALFEFLQARPAYANILSITRFAFEDPRALLIFAFAGAPTFSALAVVWLADGRAGLTTLLGRLKPWGPGVSSQKGALLYAELAAIYGLGIAVYLWLTSRYAGADALADTLQLLGGSIPIVIGSLILGPFIDEGGTCEELGWRGRGLPLLMDRYSAPLRATLLLGFLWWAWHFPREIPNIMASENLGHWAYYQGLFLVLCLALSVVCSWYFFRSGGSALPALLIHGFTNVWSKALAGPVFQALEIDLRTWLVIAASILIVASTRGRLGWRDREAETS